MQHYVELLRALPLWERDRIRVVDAGCGKAYLSLALVAYGRERARASSWSGSTRTPPSSRPCAAIAERLGYDEARSRRRRSRPTTTTSRSTCSSRCTPATRRPTRRSPPACGSAPRRSSSRRAAITSSPAQIAKRSKDGVLRHGLLLGRQADLVTDALRAAALETLGYRVDVIEFVATEHTPKNLMLRAERAPSPDRARRRPPQYGELRDR